MKTALRPKRSGSFRDKYLALALIAAAFCIGCSTTSKAQVPSVDSLHKLTNRYITNAAVEAFANKRLNYILNGMLFRIDSAGSGGSSAVGVDTLYALNDSTIRYRKNGVSYNFLHRGANAGSRIFYDSLYINRDYRLKFGTSVISPDVTISRDSIGQIGIKDNNATYVNLKAGRGIFTQRTGYDSTYAIDDVEGNDFATRSMVEAAIDNISAGAVNTDGYTIIGQNSFVDPKRVDTTVIATHWYVDSSINAATIAGGSLTADGTTIINTAGVIATDTANIHATLYRLYKAIDSLALLTGGTAPDGSETKVEDDIGISVTGAGTIANPYKIKNTGSPGTNTQDALDARLYGLVADVVVPGSGNVVTGTNNTPMLQNAINAAKDGQIVDVSGGPYLFSTPLDTIRGSKRVRLRFNCNTYHNGSDFIIFKNQSGAQDQHSVEHYGLMIGRINIPSHTKVAHDAGTGPAWSTFTGTPFKLFNVYQVNIQFNKIIGFKNGIEFLGGANGTGNNGCQENTIAGRELALNANGITMTSLDGVSYIDKAVITGLNGGRMTIGGGLGIKMDGYLPAAPNGEIYNGAFRSNNFKVLFEGLDSGIVANGDITYNKFDITIEGGTSTGIYGSTGFKMRSIAPNYVLAPQYIGTGVYGSTKMQEGMGINGFIKVPIWNGGTYFGNDAVIDDEGNIVFQHSGNISQATRAAAPSNFRFVNTGDAETYVSITASTYSVAAKVAYIAYSNASGTITLPSASGNPFRKITVFNNHGSSAVTISNGTPVSIPAGEMMTFWSNGATWVGVVNPKGTGGGGGSSIFVSDANGYHNADKLALGGLTSATTTWLKLGTSTTGVSSFRMASGAHPTSPADGDEWRVAALRYMAYNGIVYTYLTVPDNGVAGQIVARNDANDDHVYKYGHSAFGKYHLVTNANVTVADDDFTVVIYNQSATRTMTLPDPALWLNRVLVIGQKKGNTNTINLNYSYYEGSTYTPTSALINDVTLMLQSDGTRWQRIVGGF